IDDLKHHELRAWLTREAPDYYLVHTPPGGFEKPVLSLPWFTAAYTRVYREGGIEIYKRTAPVADAQVAVTQSAQALSENLMRQLAVQGVDVSEQRRHDAITGLVGGYLNDPALQELAFSGTPGEIDFKPLATWAVGASGANGL